MDPRVVFILLLSIFSGLTAAAIDAAPQTLEAVLPEWGVDLWGVSLVTGSAVTLGGMARQTINGVIVEQIGSVIIGAATIYYSILAFIILGPGAIQPVGIILAWGIACLVRWGQLQALINSAYRQKARDDIANAVEEQIRHEKGL